MTIQPEIPNGWRKLKVNKIFEFVPTTSHSKGEMNYVEGDSSSIYNIHYGDIHAKYDIYVDFEKDSVPHLRELANGFDRNLLKSGDLVMVDASEDLEGVGTCIEIKNLNDKKCVAGLHTFALRDQAHHTAPGYRGLVLKHRAVKHRMQQVSTYSKVFGISKKSFSDIEVILPPLPEQEKIVEVLEIWDEYIEKLTKVIKFKKKVNRWLTRNLITGKIRLQGFQDKWLTSTLGEIASFRNGKGHEKNIVVNGQYIVVNSKFISTNGQIIKYSDCNFSPLNKGDIVMVMSDVPNGKAIAKCFLILFDNKYSLNQRICAINSKKIISEFLYRLLNRNKYFLAFDDGAKQTNLRKDDILACPIKYPPLEEQTAIAKILTTADQEIEALERKKELIANQKKFLLNNLVTGRIRLPEFVKAKRPLTGT